MKTHNHINENNWISVKEKLPENIGVYLTYKSIKAKTIKTTKFNPEDIYSNDRLKHINKFRRPNGLEDKYITHWMPLPNPPGE